MRTTTSIERIRPRCFAYGGVALLLALLALPMAVQAGEYWLKTVISDPISHPENWVDSNNVAPASISSDDVLHIDGGKTLILASSALTSDLTYNGVLHIGAENGATAATIRFQKGMTFGDLRWNSAVLHVYTANKMLEVSGRAIVDNPLATHKATFTATKNRYGGLFLNANLQSSSDFNGSILMDTTSTMPEQTLFVVGGNNANYYGKFNLSMPDFAFVLAHANALGSPSASCADALSVEVANAILSVTNGVTPNAARGITIDASGFRIRATTYDFSDAAATPYEDCSAFELPMPITGTYGFTKDGEGTVTLSGAYTAGDIVVSNGTLRIESSATFPAGQKISVASGAALYAVKSPSGFVVDAEPGAVVRFGLDPITIPYDDTTHTATAVTRDSSYQIPSGTVQEIALSEPVKLPLHVAPLRQEVLTVAAGAADLSADDFVDATEKTYGLPKTSFTVEKDGDGVQHVYLTIRPVVVSKANFDNTLNGTSSTWSNDAAAHEGFDYLITNTVSNAGNEEFAGDSLTVCNEYIYTRANACKITKATIYAPTLIQQGRTGRNPDISGDIRIAGSFDDTSYVTFSEKYNSGEFHRLSATLTGEGPLKVTGYTTGENIFAQIYGNNSAYKGRIYVTNNGSPDEYTGTQLGFNSTNALGGALDTFKYNALTLDKFSRLCPTTSMEFSTQNRGIYGSGPFGFDVTNGITFKVGVPVKMDNIMFKHGEGDLILGGAISYGGSSTKTCYVREGGIGALNDAAVAGLDVVFSNATKIVLSSDATLVNGFTGNLSFPPADATVSVVLASDFTPPANGEAFTVAIATVPTSEGDLSSRFALEGGLRGYTGTIVTESVGDNTRYSARYTHNGMIIIFR